MLNRTVFPLSVVRAGSCQCGSFFNLDPLKRGGHFDGIDELASNCAKLGGVTTLLTTPLKREGGNPVPVCKIWLHRQRKRRQQRENRDDDPEETPF